MVLEAVFVKRLAALTVEIAISCAAGELLALVGPSGAGKTTIIRTIAGLERPEQGRIDLNGETWVDTDQGFFLPARKRGLGYVFQEYTLFPHLTVAENAAFGAVDRQEAGRWLKRLAILHLGNRRPHEISGGERQRTALAQALTRRPRLLLLDEPFSALDVVTRTRLREDLKGLKSDLGIPILLVTHDLEEARFLADRLLAIEQGAAAPAWLGRSLAAGDCFFGEQEERCAALSTVP